MRFTYEEDLQSVLTAGMWTLNLLILILSKWVPDFNPNLQRHNGLWT